VNAVVPVVVFSGVDGVLHAPTESAIARAARALALLARDRISLVLCSSKTRAELELIQQELGIRQPFVVEGGAAAFIPRGYFGAAVKDAREIAGYEALEFGRPYADVVQFLRDTARRLAIEVVGFSDMSVEQVATECRLPLLRARLAKLREYVEAFRFVDRTSEKRVRLLKALTAAGLRCASRGEYEYVGAVPDSGGAVKLLRNLYRQSHGAVHTMGLADAYGDEELLSLTDSQVIVHDDDSVTGAVDLGDWAEAIVEMVQERREQDASASRRPRRRPRVNVAW
jgi:mannosyl-3-phosphoglycerate phosphatase